MNGIGGFGQKERCEVGAGKEGGKGKHAADVNKRGN
jgi:hypothetical protein